MFHHMEYVYQVYQTKSFSKAAADLYISQPSLSSTIKKVEERVGSPLFDRSVSPIKLTQCGQEYIKCVEKIREVQTGFSNYLNDSADLKTGTITIGASSFFTAYIMPSIIAAFKTTYPNIQMNLLEVESKRAEKMLFSGEVDMIIDNAAYSEAIYKKVLFSSEHLILVAPKTMVLPAHLPYALTATDIRQKKHLQPETEPVPIELFEGFPFIALRHGNDTRDRVERIRQKFNFTPKIVLEFDQMATVYHVACQGIGTTIISDTLIQEIQTDPRLVYFRLGGSAIYRENHFYYKKGKYLSQAMKRFITFATAREQEKATTLAGLK